MGVTGIWEYMQKHAETVDIGELGGKVLAVDGHIWLFESSKGCQAHGMSGASYLVTFFNRCQRLREHGIEPIVVFDQIVYAPDPSQSPHHIHIKKSRRSGGNGWNTSIFNDLSKRVMNVRTLLSHMGVRCVSGGSDGEAQCAQLEEAGLVDGCITPDFDYFLYGGQNLYKIEFINGGRGINPRVTYFSMNKLHTLNLNRYRLVALAMLLGCDYLEGGVGRVGIVTALEILAEFTVHDDDHTISILDRFASYHREEIPLRSHDPQAKKKLRTAKINIPDGFPNTDMFCEAASVYLVPNVQKFTEESLPAKGPINMDAVSAILEKECNWKPERISQELSKTENRTKTSRKASQQTHISDFFQTRRRSAPVPVVIACSQAERKKCTQREWSALLRLRYRADLYAVKGEPDVNIEETPVKEAPSTKLPQVRKRPRKLHLGEDDTTPTTSTPKRRLTTNNDGITCSDTSSIIILN